MQRQHQEGSAAAGIYDDRHKARVDGAERAVPSDAGDADVVVTLVVFHRLAKHVPEFALSYHSPHRVCREENRKIKISVMASTKNRRGTLSSAASSASSNTNIQSHLVFLRLALDLPNSHPLSPFSLFF